MTTLNTIDVDQHGNCTVYGEVAARVWDYGRGKFPCKQCGANRYFVVQPVGGENIVRAASSQPPLGYMADDRVLISIITA